MARPKANTPEGKIANEKWHKTMEEKYGSITAKMQECGRKGGLNGRGPNYKGGFAADNERAKTAGAKGGHISKRKSKYTNTFEENKEAIKQTLNSKATLKNLAESMGVPYSSLLNYIKKHITE